QRCVLHGVFIRSGSAVEVSRIGVPGRWRIRMVIGDFAVADDYVMRQHATDGLMEPAGDGFVGDLELRPGFGAAGMNFLQALLYKVQRAGRRVGLEISPRPVALDGVAPLWNLPLEFGFTFAGGLGQVDLHTLAGSLDISNIHL